MANKINSAVSLEDMKSAARQRIAEGTAEAGDYKLVADEYGLGLNASPKYDLVGVTNTSGSSTTTSEQSSTSNSNQSSSSTQNQSGTSYRKLPGITYDANGNPIQASIDTKENAYGAALDEANMTLSNALGVSQEKINAMRDKQQAEDMKRAKVNELVNASRLVSDMVSAFGGGSVYERKPDTTVKEAYDNARRLQELRAAEDAQAAQTKAKLAYDAAIKRLEHKDATETALAQNITSSTGTSNSASVNNSSAYSKGKSTTTSNQTSTTSYDKKAAGQMTYVKNDGSADTFDLTDDEIEKVAIVTADAYNAAVTPDAKKYVLESVGAVITEDGNIAFPNGVRYDKAVVSSKVAKVIDSIMTLKGSTPTVRKGAGDSVRPSQRTTTQGNPNVRPSARK